MAERPSTLWLEKFINAVKKIVGDQEHTALSSVDYDAMRDELQRTVDGERRKVRDTVYARPTYTISLAPDDMKDVVSGNFQEVMEKGLKEDTQRYINERGYVLNAPLSVRLRAEPRLERGYIGISATWVQFDPGKPENRTIIRPPVGSKIAVVIVTNGKEAGREVPILRFPVIIGRDSEDSDADIRVSSPSRGVSRRHLRIEQDLSGMHAVRMGENDVSLIGVADAMKMGERYPLRDGARLILADEVELEVRSKDRSTAFGWDKPSSHPVRL